MLAIMSYGALVVCVATFAEVHFWMSSFNLLVDHGDLYVHTIYIIEKTLPQWRAAGDVLSVSTTIHFHLTSSFQWENRCVLRKNSSDYILMKGAISTIQNTLDALSKRLSINLFKMTTKTTSTLRITDLPWGISISYHRIGHVHRGTQNMILVP